MADDISEAFTDGAPVRLRVARRVRRAIGIFPGRPDPLTGLRLAAAFVGPIAVGQALGETLSGLFVGIGAFMVANADLGGPSSQRARVQLAVSCCVPASIVAGMLCASTMRSRFRSRSSS
jgi:hypothetical protein